MNIKSLRPMITVALGRQRMAMITNARKAGLALLTSGLLVLCFPHPDQGWLAWVALVPLILACRGQGLPSSFGLGLLSSMAATLGIFSWIFAVPGFQPYHALILSLYIGTYTALWCLGLSLFSRLRRPFIIIGPALWVILDYLKAHAGFMSLPWATLAQSQHRNLPLLQLATITGEYGITFLVVMGNLALAELITQRAWKRGIIAALVIGLVHIGGFIALSQPVEGKMLRVAAVQPCIRTEERKTQQGLAATLERLERLTREVAEERPTLIAWPETAVPHLPYDHLLRERVSRLAKEIGISLVVGTAQITKFSRKDDGTDPLAMERRFYNSAYLITPKGPYPDPYRKVILLPFGEYLPLEGFINWPEWLVPKLFQEIPGDRPKCFQLAEEIWFTVRICWEGVFADLLRQSVKEGAHLLVQINNAERFGRSAAEPQHNLTSVLRAVENRIPVIVASNTGPSLIIDPYGRIIASLPEFFATGAIAADVPVKNRQTLYTRLGDIFAGICIAGTILITARAAANRKRNKIIRN